MIDVGRQIYEKVDSEAADLRQIGHLASRKIGTSGPRIRSSSWSTPSRALGRADRPVRGHAARRPVRAAGRQHQPPLSGDAGYGGEAQTSAALQKAGVRHIRLGMEPSWPALDILRAIQPDVILRQSQWEQDVPPAFATSRLSFARICSVPYGMSIVGKFSPGDESVGGVNEQSFDQYYHRMAWRVFCETEQTRDYFPAVRPLRSGEVHRQRLSQADPPAARARRGRTLAHRHRWRAPLPRHLGAALLGQDGLAGLRHLRSDLPRLPCLGQRAVRYRFRPETAPCPVHVRGAQRRAAATRTRRFPGSMAGASELRVGTRDLRASVRRLRPDGYGWPVLLHRISDLRKAADLIDSGPAMCR